MKDLCVPVPNFGNDQVVELTVKIAGEEMCYSFRVESFPWKTDRSEIDSPPDSLQRISRLKEAIAEYDKSWELIQIYTPAENATHIQVLYRKRR